MKCRSSKTLQRLNVAVVKCHNRRNVGWTFRAGQSVVWMFWGWTIHQGMVVIQSVHLETRCHSGSSETLDVCGRWTFSGVKMS
jgi:hypothetical protein